MLHTRFESGRKAGWDRLQQVMTTARVSSEPGHEIVGPADPFAARQPVKEGNDVLAHRGTCGRRRDARSEARPGSLLNRPTCTQSMEREVLGANWTCGCEANRALAWRNAG